MLLFLFLSHFIPSTLVCGRYKITRMFNFLQQTWKYRELINSLLWVFATCRWRGLSEQRKRALKALWMKSSAFSLSRNLPSAEDSWCTRFVQFHYFNIEEDLEELRNKILIVKLIKGDLDLWSVLANIHNVNLIFKSEKFNQVRVFYFVCNCCNSLI